MDPVFFDWEKVNPSCRGRGKIKPVMMKMIAFIITLGEMM